MDLDLLLGQALERSITREEALFLLQATQDDTEAAEKLFAASREVRRRLTGDVFTFTGGIASVLPCRLEPLCVYCPYWRKEDRRPLPVEAIVAGARYFREQGVKAFHLSGGTTLGSEGLEVLNIVRHIWDAGLHDMQISVNCGAAMSIDTMRELKKMGVISVGAVFEITNPAVFRQMKPGDNLERKQKFAWDIGESGLALGSGLMAGLGPEESRLEDYVNSIFDVAQYPHLRSLYISKFTPDPLIPLRDKPACSTQEAARFLAVARLVLRGIHITTAAGWTEEERLLGLQAGAGNTLFALAINLKVNYWKDRQRTATAVFENIEYRDTRPQKREAARHCGLTIQEPDLSNS